MKTILYIITGFLMFCSFQLKAAEEQKTSSAKNTTTKPDKTNSKAQEIFVFCRGKNGISRFKIYQKRNYKRIEDGTFFTLSTENGKQLAKDEKGTVYEPTWEIKNSFSNYLLTPSKYLAQLDSKISFLKYKLKSAKERQKDLAEREAKREKVRVDLAIASGQKVIYSTSKKNRNRRHKSDIEKLDDDIEEYEKQIYSIQTHKKKIQDKLKTVGKANS